MIIFYLKNKYSGDYEAKFVPEANDRFEGTIYEGTCWSEGETLEWCFFAHVFAKWDGCTHWWFYGEDYENGKKEANGYYHICSSLEQFIINMCFAWRLARDFHLKNHSVGLSDEINGEYDLDIVGKMLENYEIVQKEEV